MKPLLLFVFVIYASTVAAGCKVPRQSQIDEQTGLKTYTPKGKVSEGQVLVLPPTGGENFTDRKIAQKLCRRGLEVHVLNYPQPSGLTLDLGVHERTTQLVLGSVKEFMLQYPNPTVLVGASLGGIYASIIYSLGTQHADAHPAFAPVKGLVTAVAGGSLADILVASKIEGAIEQRRLRFASGAYRDRADYHARLEQAIETDSLRLARPSDAVLAYVSLNDEKVPTRTQFQLARAHGARVRTIRVLGHPTSVLYTYFTQGDEIAAFAKRILRRE